MIKILNTLNRNSNGKYTVIIYNLTQLKLLSIRLIE